MKKVLFASSECVPFIKTGGLADVVGSLPKCFDKRYYDVRVILPKYSCMKQQWKDMMQYKTHFYMDFAGQSQYVGVLECVYDGITFYFIDNEHYFTGDKPYTEHHWDIEKFMYFDRAVLSALPLLDFRPDVIHCHDWQTGLIPVYLHDSFAGGDFFRGIKTVMTIHNLKFQGNDGVEQFKRISGLSDYYFTIDKLRTGVDGNMLKGGLVYADAITTVSNTYAEEIKTQFYGEGLDGLMRARANDLRGIVNGIDYDANNPETSKKIYANFSAEDLTGKAKNKAQLQKDLGLPVRPDVPVFSIISRLVEQKGINLVLQAAGELLSKDVQLVILGTGDYTYENMFKDLAYRYPDKVSANILFDDALSQKIYAASDFFLMPSLFEPCGLGQLFAMSYGTIPVTRTTGGLVDTVKVYNPEIGEGNGFQFQDYDANGLMWAINEGLKIYADKAQWNKVVHNAIETRFSWDRSAKEYIDVYNKILEEHPQEKEEEEN